MNHLYYSDIRCGGTASYCVTLITGRDEFVQKVSKTVDFESEAEAKAFMRKCVSVTNNKPFDALTAFNRAKGVANAEIYQVANQGQKIRHIIGDSVWIGIVYCNGIERTDESGKKFYKTLGTFAKAHHKEANTQKKTVKGWDECDAQVNGEWIKMNVLREIMI